MELRTIGHPRTSWRRRTVLSIPSGSVFMCVCVSMNLCEYEYMRVSLYTCVVCMCVYLCIRMRPRTDEKQRKTDTWTEI